MSPSSVPCAVVILFAFAFICKSQPNSTNTSITTTSAPITSTTAYFTTATQQECSANYAFVYIESSFFSQTIASERVNYPPYAYTNTVINKKIVSFADGATITDSINNPCNVSTWTTPSSFYEDTIVLITYNSYYDAMCTSQQWTLNLESYSNVTAVLIANDNDLTSVYTLSGDESLSDPTIPTRMISLNSATKIMNASSGDTYGSISCYNDSSHPPKICVSDSSSVYNQKNAVLDGEFQEQGTEICVICHHFSSHSVIRVL